MPVSINGQVVVVVGASSGIGRAAAVLFAREGAKVVAAARREDRLQSLKQELATENSTTSRFGVLMPRTPKTCSSSPRRRSNSLEKSTSW